MIFNQFEFLLLFLPATLVFVFLPPLRQYRIWLLTAASFVFYGISGVEHAFVLMAGIIWVYVLTHVPAAKGSRWRLTLAIIGPAAALTYYKYSAFLVSQVVGLERNNNENVFSLFENVLLPAGISFFTFQLIAFAVDRYRGALDMSPKLGDLAFYVSFFPQLVAGPIVRYSQVQAAIVGLSSWRPRRSDIEEAIGFVVIGLAAKVLIADTLSHYVGPLIENPAAMTTTASLFVLFGFSFQIYFDFYGYSLVAIGLGRLFGFHLPNNFLRPYESRNPKDFWRRWHVSLSYWIRDYLYIPMGGNRRYHLNIAIVFAFVGLWHGAGWNFVAWGLFHAAIVVGYSLTAHLWDRMPTIVQKSVTFSLVTFGWILFLFDLDGAASFYASLVGLTNGTNTAPSVEMWVALIVAALVCFGLRFEDIIIRVNRSGVSRTAYGAGLALTLSATLLFVDRSETFIYFRF